MKVAVFDAHRFERPELERSNVSIGHELLFFEPRLDASTARLARGSAAVCAFVNDTLSGETIRILAEEGVRLIALRSAGFNHVDLCAAAQFGIKVVRVPAYSPHAIAEHAIALMLTLNRKVHRAWSRVRENNFSLDGLVGFDLHQKTVGVLGTGKIGAVVARILRGFGCNVLAYDQCPDASLAADPGIRYASLEEIYGRSRVLSLHLPLSDQTRHIIDERAIAQMKRGVMLINTGRGGLIDSSALLDGLKSGVIGAAGLDVYEREAEVFFQDLSGQPLKDDILARLISFPNVLITSHQAFLTEEALSEIARTTLTNISEFERNAPLSNEVRAQQAPILPPRP